MKKTIFLLTLISIFTLFSCEEDKLKELECPKGYNLSADKKSCNDIDECFFGGGCEEICTNTKGSYICECEKQGYVADENGVCADENECETDNGGCFQNCVNEDGGFHCSCEDGYVLNEDKKSCDDIDDCIGVCQNAECIDGVNSYTCGECFENYTGDNCEFCIDGLEYYGEQCLNSPFMANLGQYLMLSGRNFVFDNEDNIYITGDDGIGGISLNKFNSNLEEQWSKYYRYSSEKDTGRIIAIDEDKNLYIAGVTTGNFAGVNSGDTDIILMKTDSEGNELWKRQRGSLNEDEVLDIILDKDNNIFITGYKYSYLNGENEEPTIMLFLKKFNSFGEEIWTKEENLETKKFSYNLAIDNKNNIYIGTLTSGSLEDTQNTGANDILLLKYDNNGNKIWAKQFGTQGYENVRKVLIKDNEIFITGYTNGYYDEEQTYVYGNTCFIKTDIDGNILIDKTWIEDTSTTGSSIAISDNGEIYISGYDYVGKFYYPTMMLKKLDSNGELMWSKKWTDSDYRTLDFINFSSTGVLYGGGTMSTYYSSKLPFLMKFDF